MMSFCFTAASFLFILDKAPATVQYVLLIDPGYFIGRLGEQGPRPGRQLHGGGGVPRLLRDLRPARPGRLDRED